MLEFELDAALRRFQAGATLYVSGVDVVDGSAVPEAKLECGHF